jgi:hypothetical protein
VVLQSSRVVSCILSLGRVQDALSKKGEVGPPIALTLEEFQAMDVAFRHPV